jgi:stage V sporulation protein G
MLKYRNTKTGWSNSFHYLLRLTKGLNEKAMKPKISEIQIIPIKPMNGLVAFTSFVLNDWLYLGSIGIFTRLEGGYRLTYPTRKVGNRNINIFHPIDKSFAEEIEKEIIKKFEDVVKENDRYDCSYA